MICDRCRPLYLIFASLCTVILAIGSALKLRRLGKAALQRYTKILENAQSPARRLDATCYVQVAHFLDADLQPWAAALAAALFTEAACPAAGAQPSDQLGGGREQAEVAPANKHCERWQAAWRRVGELARLDGAADAVLRAWRLPLLEQLPRTLAEWQPAVISSHAVNGALRLDFATAAACRGAMHGLHDVHSLSFDCTTPCQARSLPSTQKINLTLHALATMPALRSLAIDICWALWTKPGHIRAVQALPPALSCLPQLSSLRLNGVVVGAVALAPLLRSLTALTALDLRNHDIGVDGAAALAPALSRLSHLAFLCLDANCIDAADVVALAPSLGSLTALTALVGCRNRFGDAGAVALAPALGRLSRLATLDLSSNQIGAAGTAALAISLMVLTALTVLDLSDHTFGDAGLWLTASEVLVPALRRLPQLAALDFAQHRIGVAGAVALAQPIGTLTALTALCLYANELGDAGAEALVPALSRLQQLQDLHLGINDIGATGAAALAHPLGALTTLPALYLDTNEVADTGAQVLAPALSRLSQLEVLHLAYNLLSDTGLARLTPALARLTNLSHLRLFGRNPMSGAAVAQCRTGILASNRHINID